MAETNKLTGAPNGVYLGLTYISFFILVFLPGYYLLWGGMNGVDGVIKEIYNNITYNSNSTLSTVEGLIKVLTTLFGAIAIGVIYFAPSVLRNPLNFAMFHIVKTLETIKSQNLKDTDKELYNNAIFKITSYSIVWIGLFVLYYFLIQDIIRPIIEGSATVTNLIGTIVKGLAILTINTGAIIFIEGFDPAPELDKGELKYDSKIAKDAQDKASTSNGVLGALVLLLATIAALGVSKGISSTTVQTIESNIGQQNNAIIEEATGAGSTNNGGIDFGDDSGFGTIDIN